MAVHSLGAYSLERRRRIQENLRLLRELRLRPMVPALRDVVAAAPADLRRFVRQVSMLRLEASLEDPPGWVLALLRRFRPALAVGAVTLATRANDVVTVLRDEKAFNVRPYGRAMAELVGPFALGLDGAEHTAARQSLESVLAPINLAALRSWAEETAEQLVTERCRDGRLDVVADLAERLPARFAAEYLGVAGPDEETLILWCKALFEAIFLNLAGQRSLAADGAKAAVALRCHLDELVADTRRNGRGDHATVLQRLVAADQTTPASCDDTFICSNLIGLVVGAIPTVSEATARAVDRLLCSGGAFAGARSAAERGDHEMLWRYIREALRFAPQSPGLIREAANPTALPQSAAGGDAIDAGDIIFASTASAMRDPKLVKRPTRFRANRPDAAYLHFGTGSHRCLGEHLAPILMTAAAGALFRRRGLRRVPGSAGRLAIEGRWPTRLTVAL
jgi:cytochrome P450